jgi:hypothetical protein
MALAGSIAKPTRQPSCWLTSLKTHTLPCYPATPQALPGAAKPRYLLASALAELGHLAEAVQQLQEAARMDPGNRVGGVAGMPALRCCRAPL